MTPRVLGLALVAACARGPTASPTQEELHALVDCPWVADGCSSDGCSLTEGHAPIVVAPPAACGPAVPYPQLLADARQQLRTKPWLTSVRIVAPTVACAASVREVLEARTRLEVSVRPTRLVQLEVAAWKGVRCDGRDGRDED